MGRAGRPQFDTIGVGESHNFVRVRGLELTRPRSLHHDGQRTSRSLRSIGQFSGISRRL